MKWKDTFKCQPLTARMNILTFFKINLFILKRVTSIAIRKIVIKIKSLNTFKGFFIILQISALSLNKNI